jgi:hypothetical protein
MCLNICGLDELCEDNNLKSTIASLISESPKAKETLTASHLRNEFQNISRSREEDEENHRLKRETER